MKTVNMHEAKTHLSRLVEAAKGEPFVIARAGKPLVKVVALEGPVERKPQIFGFLKGQFTYDPEVDRQLDEEIREMFEQSSRNSPLEWPEPEGEAGGETGGTTEEGSADRRAGA